MEGGSIREKKQSVLYDLGLTRDLIDLEPMQARVKQYIEIINGLTGLTIRMDIIAILYMIGEQKTYGLPTEKMDGNIINFMTYFIKPV